MKLIKKDIKQLSKILKKAPFNPIMEKSFFVFPFELATGEDDLIMNSPARDTRTIIPAVTFYKVLESKGNFDLHAKKNDKDNTYSFFAEPEKNKYIVKEGIAYVNLSYVQKVDFVEYLEFFDKVSDKDKEFLQNLDCYLVGKEYISEIFEL